MGRINAWSGEIELPSGKRLWAEVRAEAGVGGTLEVQIEGEPAAFQRTVLLEELVRLLLAELLERRGGIVEIRRRLGHAGGEPLFAGVDRVAAAFRALPPSPAPRVNLDAAGPLKDAIRAFAVGAPGGEPSGKAEEALDDLQRALHPREFRGAPERVPAAPARANGASAALCEALAEDTRRLRIAAEAYFGGDFRAPHEPYTGATSGEESARLERVKTDRRAIEVLAGRPIDWGDGLDADLRPVAPPEGEGKTARPGRRETRDEEPDHEHPVIGTGGAT